LRTVKSTLLALQLNPYEIQELISSIEKKSKYQQLNMYISQDTYKHMDAVFIEHHFFLDVQKKLKSLVTVQSLVRSWLCRKRYIQMREKFIKSPLFQRNKIFRELVKKETTYVNNLSQIVNEYLLPLREVCYILCRHEYSLLISLFTKRPIRRKRASLAKQRLIQPSSILRSSEKSTKRFLVLQQISKR